MSDLRIGDMVWARKPNNLMDFPVWLEPEMDIFIGRLLRIIDMVIDFEKNRTIYRLEYSYKQFWFHREWLIRPCKSISKVI